MHSALNPLMEHLDCEQCHDTLRDRIKDVVVQWASVGVSAVLLCSHLPFECCCVIFYSFIPTPFLFSLFFFALSMEIRIRLCVAALSRWMAFVVWNGSGMGYSIGTLYPILHRQDRAIPIADFILLFL